VVQLHDFRQLVKRLAQEVPPAYLDGVVAVDVSPKALPHPVHADVYTLGECVPIEWSGDGSDLQSRVVLYHGSFQALARLGDFDWREETWDTLTHELRHHLEWRARVAALEAYDWAAEQNFARREGEAFDAAFYRSGESIDARVFKVEDDMFVEGAESREPQPLTLTWHGRRYRVPLPGAVGRPAFVTLEGLVDPPPGQAVLVLPRRPGLRDLFRRQEPAQLAVTVEVIDE
jgi:hypothetical protein